MKNTVGTRIADLRYKQGYSLRDLAVLTGINHTTLNEYESDFVKRPKFQTLQKIAEALKTNVDYLLYGDVDKTSDQINKMPPKIVYVDSKDQKNKIALVPVSAQAGYLKNYNEEKFIKELPLYDLPGFNNGIFRMFTVQGVSMEPTFKDGDVLVCEYVEHYGDIRDNQVYVVVSTEGIVVKRVVNKIDEKKAIMILSDNEEYNPDFILRDNILEIWKYHSVLRKGLPI